MLGQRVAVHRELHRGAAAGCDDSISQRGKVPPPGVSQVEGGRVLLAVGTKAGQAHGYKGRGRGKGMLGT